jgi:hypothetical protein
MCALVSQILWHTEVVEAYGNEEGCLGEPAADGGANSKENGRLRMHNYRDMVLTKQGRRCGCDQSMAVTPATCRDGFTFDIMVYVLVQEEQSVVCNRSCVLWTRIVCLMKLSAGLPLALAVIALLCPDGARQLVLGSWCLRCGRSAASWLPYMMCGWAKACWSGGDLGKLSSPIEPVRMPPLVCSSLG